MLERKLIRILMRMKADERKEFAEFLRSPLHSHRPKLGHMVELMEGLVFQIDAAVSNEVYYEAVYPGKPYDPNNLNRLISVIFKELKEYLALLRYRKDRAARHIYTLREYADRKWADMTLSGMKEARMRLNTEIPEGEDYYYQHYQIGKVEGEYWVQNMPKKPGLIYQPALNRLDEFYLLAKAKFMVLAINHDRLHDMQHERNHESLLHDSLANDSFSDRMLIHLFLKIYECRNNPDSDELILEFIETLKNKIPYFDTNEKQIGDGPSISKDYAELLYGMAFNHATEFRYKRGNSWIPILNNIMNEALRKGVFLKDGKLYDQLFLSQIKTLCVNGYVDLAFDFFNEFKDLLAEDPVDSVSDYSIALIQYFNNDFRISHKLLLGLKSRIGQISNVTLACDCRLLLCLSWYQIKDTDSMIHEVNAFRTQLNRDQALKDDSRKSYKRFCGTMLKLERALGGPPQDRLKKLQMIKEKSTNVRINGKGLISKIIEQEMGK